MGASELAMIGQFAVMALAAMVGRSVRSRWRIWLWAFLGAAAAMVINMSVDGQGAFLLLLFAPLIYFFAVAGRRDIGGRRLL